jgi:hypothetical protein
MTFSLTRLAAATFLLHTALALPAVAGDYVPDDAVTERLSVEGWVTTATARVTVSVEAAVDANSAASARDTMQKAVNGLAPKGDWRLTSFNRYQDPTGLERWQTSYEARLPEADIGGLADRAKKSGKAGMQIQVQSVDFTPTLDEVEAVRSQLRSQLYKRAGEELKSINAAFPDRKFRIGAVDFIGGGVSFARPMMRAKQTMELMASASAPAMAADGGGMEAAQKLTLVATVTFASAPTATPAKP